MAILVTCSCGRKLRISEEYAGQQGQCPGCQALLDIPSLQTPDDTPMPLVTRVVPIPVPDQAPDRREAPPPAEPPPDDGQQIGNHGGGPLRDNGDFFVDPPPEIGPLVSAETTLRQSQKSISPFMRFVALVLAPGGTGLVTVFILTALNVREVRMYDLLTITLGAVVFVVTLYATEFRHTCSYVGRDGVARYVCKGRRNRVVQAKLFVFRDASDLRTHHLSRYVNGAYQGTTYTFTWYDVAGRARHVIKGTHKSRDGSPPTRDPYHYARSAEFAWTLSILQQALRKLQLSEPVLFNVGSGQWLRIREDGLEFRLGSNEDVWAKDDLAAVRVDQGTVKILRHDAREGWFSSTGVLKFPFDQLANAQLFFHLLDKVLEVRPA